MAGAVEGLRTPLWDAPRMTYWLAACAGSNDSIGSKTHWLCKQIIPFLNRNAYIKPLVSGVRAANANFQIIAGEGRSRTGIRVVAKCENAEGAPELGLAEGSGLGFAKGAQVTGTALDDAAGDLARECGGFGARTRRKREDMKIGERQTFDKGYRGGVVVFGFAGEAGDDVGADGGVGETLMDECDAARIVLGAVPAVHGGEDAVGAGLQRSMEVLGHAIGRSEEIDEVSGNVKRFDGTDAEPLHRSFVEDAAEQIFEFDVRGKIAAVGAEVDAAEHNFSCRGRHERRRSANRQECLSHDEALNFLNDGVRRQAAASPANKRNHAVGTAGVAAVLDFKGGAGVISFPTENGGGEKFGAVEDVADEDPAGPGRSIPSATLGIKLLPCERMKRNSRVTMQCGGGEKVVRRFTRDRGRE